MKLFHLLPGFSLLLLCSCTMFYSKEPATETSVSSPKPLAIPAGKHWQIVEEPPKLSDDSGRLPFQKEESLQPDGAASAPPADNRRIDIPR